jgi:hypothetical protein
VSAMVGVLQDRYGLRKRDEAPGTAQETTATSEPAVLLPQQVGFAW